MNFFFCFGCRWISRKTGSQNAYFMLKCSKTTVWRKYSRFKEILLELFFEIMNLQGREFLFKSNKHACTSLQCTRVTDFAFSFLNSFFASIVHKKNFGQCFIKLVTMLRLLRAMKCFLFSFLWPSKTWPFLFGLSYTTMEKFTKFCPEIS